MCFIGVRSSVHLLLIYLAATYWRYTCSSELTEGVLLAACFVCEPSLPSLSEGVTRIDRSKLKLSAAYNVNITYCGAGSVNLTTDVLFISLRGFL